MIEQVVIDYRINKYNSAKDIKEKLDYFRQISDNGIHNLTDQELDNLKAEFIKFQNVIFTFFADTYPTKLFRVTNNKYLYNGKKVKLQKVTDLIGPSQGKSNYGRCNMKGESVFYAALDFKTAIWETRPQVDDFITVSEWEIKPGEKLNTHFIFHPKLTQVNKESSNAYNAWLESKKQINPELVDIFDELILFLTEQYKDKLNGYSFLIFLRESIFNHHILLDITKRFGVGIRTIFAGGERIQYSPIRMTGESVLYYDEDKISEYGKRILNTQFLYNPAEFQMNTAFAKAFTIDTLGSKKRIFVNGLYIEDLFFNLIDGIPDIKIQIEDNKSEINIYLKSNLMFRLGIGEILLKEIKGLKVKIYRIDKYFIFKEFDGDDLEFILFDNKM